MKNVHGRQSINLHIEDDSIREIERGRYIILIHYIDPVIIGAREREMRWKGNSWRLLCVPGTHPIHSVTGDHHLL